MLILILIWISVISLFVALFAHAKKREVQHVAMKYEKTGRWLLSNQIQVAAALNDILSGRRRSMLPALLEKVQEKFEEASQLRILLLDTWQLLEENDGSPYELDHRFKSTVKKRSDNNVTDLGPRNSLPRRRAEDCAIVSRELRKEIGC